MAVVVYQIFLFRCLHFGFDKFDSSPCAPLVGIPTTAGTGSEVSRVTVVADESGKQALYGDYLQPKAALVDPLLHADLPPLLTAITGLDALGHALECTASKKSNAIGDAVAREALVAGCPAYEAVVVGGGNAGVRYQMARCKVEWCFVRVMVLNLTLPLAVSYTHLTLPTNREV